MSDSSTMPATTGWRRVVMRPDWVFLLLGLSFGLALVVLTPPIQVPDEGPHYFRSYQLSEGQIIARKEKGTTGDYLPRSLQSFFEAFWPIEHHRERKTSAAEIGSFLKQPLDPHERVFVEFPNTAIHSPLCYVPQALGVAIARIFSPRVGVAFYAGRVCNLLAALGLIFVAIRRTPVCKWSLAVLALTPMSLFEMASLSSDAVTNGLAFLLLAQIFWCAFGPEEPLSRRSLLSLILLGTALGLTKQMYFLLPLAFLLVPVRKLGTRRRYVTFLAVFQLATLLAVAGWAVVVRNIYSPMYPNIDPMQQLDLVLQTPFGFVKQLFRTATVGFPGTIREYVGVLGTLDTPVPLWVTIGEITLLIGVFLADSVPRKDITLRQPLMALAVAFLEYGLILVVIHLTWDRVGYQGVIDIQGRYFIPLGPLVAFAVSRLGALRPAAVDGLGRLIPIASIAAPVAMLSVTLSVLHSRYFVDTPVDAAERNFLTAMDLLKQKGHELQALAHLREAIRLNPENAEAQYNLAVLLARSQPREAIRHYRIAARLSPDSFVVHNNLANLLSRHKEFTEAIKHYREALRLRPNDPIIRRNLARAQQDKQAQENALQNPLAAP